MDKGIYQAQQIGIVNPMPLTWLGRPTAPNIRQSMAPFTLPQTRAIIDEIAYLCSKWNYKQYQSGTYQIGAYNFTASVLSEYGYINAGSYAIFQNKAVNYASAWTGLAGAMSQQAFLTLTTVQDQLALQLMSDNYQAMLVNGAISSSDDLSTIAGMLVVAHFLTPGTAGSGINVFGSGAWNWRFYATGIADGLSGAQLFNHGVYAIQVLAG